MLQKSRRTAIRGALITVATLMVLSGCGTLNGSRKAAVQATYPYQKLTSVGQQWLMVNHVVGDVANQFKHRYWGWERTDHCSTSSVYKDFCRDVPERFYREVERVFARAARTQPLLGDAGRVHYSWRQVVRLPETTAVAPHLVVDFRFTTEVEEAGRHRWDLLMRAVVDLDRWKILYWKAYANPEPSTYAALAEKAAGCLVRRPPFRTVLPPGMDFDQLRTDPLADKRLLSVSACRGEPRRLFYFDRGGGVYERQESHSATGFNLVKVAEFDPSAAY